jgi:hypothetical protein
MQSVEDFMIEYLRSRRIRVETEVNEEMTFRRNFFAEECRWNNRAKELEVARNEHIVRVWYDDTKAYVSTQVPSPYFQMRYRLQRNGDGWLIRCVEVKCAKCLGPTCAMCDGTGWLGMRDQPGEIVPEPDSVVRRFSEGH